MSTSNSDGFLGRIAASGRIANEQGRPRDCCPLAEGSAARTAWLQGWDDAQIDREIWEGDNDYRARHCSEGQS